MKHNRTDFIGKTDQCTVTVGDFNSTLSAIDRPARTSQQGRAGLDAEGEVKTGGRNTNNRHQFTGRKLQGSEVTSDERGERKGQSRAACEHQENKNDD